MALTTMFYNMLDRTLHNLPAVLSPNPSRRASELRLMEAPQMADSFPD